MKNRTIVKRLLLTQDEADELDKLAQACTSGNVSELIRQALRSYAKAKLDEAWEINERLQIKP